MLLGIDAERLHLGRVGRDRDEVLRDRGVVAPSAASNHVARGARVGHRLEGRERLRRDDEERLRGVEVARRSTRSVPSTFDTKRNVSVAPAEGGAALRTPSPGPRSDPPMPMLTTLRIGRPCNRVQAPLRTRLGEARPCDRAPRARRPPRRGRPPRSTRPRGARSATCSTGAVLGDVDLLARNIASIRSAARAPRRARRAAPSSRRSCDASSSRDTVRRLCGSTAHPEGGPPRRDRGDGRRRSRRDAPAGHATRSAPGGGSCPRHELRSNDISRSKPSYVKDLIQAPPMPSGASASVRRSVAVTEPGTPRPRAPSPAVGPGSCGPHAASWIGCAIQAGRRGGGGCHDPRSVGNAHHP